MVLDKEHVAKLHAGETVTHTTMAQLVVGRSYPVSMKGSGSRNCKAVVLDIGPLEQGYLVAIKIDRTRQETPRLLHRRSQNGYTATPSMAMNREPEAVDVETQRRITEDARDHYAIRNAQALAEMEVKSAARAVRQAGIEAVRAGQDIEEFLSVVRRELDGLREGRAA